MDHRARQAEEITSRSIERPRRPDRGRAIIGSVRRNSRHAYDDEEISANSQFTAPFTRGIAHEHVLCSEVLDNLAVCPVGVHIDATVDGEGHSAGILERTAPDGRLLAIDADPDAVLVAAQLLRSFGPRAVLVQSNYAHVAFCSSSPSSRWLTGRHRSSRPAKKEREHERGLVALRNLRLRWRRMPVQELLAHSLARSLRPFTGHAWRDLRFYAEWMRSYESWLIAAVLPVLLLPGFLWPAMPLAAAVIGIVLLANLVRGENLSLGVGFDIPLAVLLIMLVVSLSVSGDSDASRPEATTTLAGVLVFWVCARRVQRGQGISTGCLWLMVIGSGVAVLGLVGTDWQPAKLFTLWPVYDHLPRLVSSVARSTSAGFPPNEVGGTLAVCLPSATGLALYLAVQKQVAPRPWQKWLRWMAVALLPFMTVVLILTQSRTSFVGCVAGLVTMLFLLLFRRNARLVQLLLVCSVALASVSAVTSEKILSGATVARSLSGLASIAAVAGTTADDGATRSEIWTNALRLMRDYPLTGAGLNTFPAVSRANYAYSWVPPDYPFAHSHNIFLQVGVDLGLPGLVAFLALLTVLAACSLRLSSSLHGQPASFLAAGLGGSLAVCVVAGLSDDSTLPFGVKSGFLFWIAAGAIAGAWRSARASTDTQPPAAGHLSGPRLLWPGVALLTAAIVVLTGPTILTWIQVNQASLALDRVLFQPPAGSAGKADSLNSILPLLQTSSRLTGSWQTVRLGRAYLELDENDAALATWRQAPAQAVAYLNSLGDARWWGRDLAPAEHFYRLSLQVASDPQTQYRLARVLESGREGEAMALYEQALASTGAGLDSASQVDARLRMGRLLAHRSDWALAVEEYDQGLATMPASGDLIVAKAEALARLSGTNQPAEALLEQASASLTGSLPLYKALVAIYLQDGQTDNARDWAQKALQAVPGSAWPHILMGQVLLEQGRATDAVRYFRQADMMRHDLADPHLGLAAAYRQLGDAGRALAESQKAAQTEPYKPEVQAAVGEILRSLGKADLARQAYQQTLILDEENEQALQGLLALERGTATVP